MVYFLNCTYWTGFWVISAHFSRISAFWFLVVWFAAALVNVHVGMGPTLGIWLAVTFCLSTTNAVLEFDGLAHLAIYSGGHKARIWFVVISHLRIIVCRLWVRAWLASGYAGYRARVIRLGESGQSSAIVWYRRCVSRRIQYDWCSDFSDVGLPWNTAIGLSDSKPSR